jgi:hypothetical protein
MACFLLLNLKVIAGCEDEKAGAFRRQSWYFLKPGI